MFPPAGTSLSGAGITFLIFVGLARVIVTFNVRYSMFGA